MLALLKEEASVPMTEEYSFPNGIDVNYPVIKLILTKYGNLPFFLENYA